MAKNDGNANSVSSVAGYRYPPHIRDALLQRASRNRRTFRQECITILIEAGEKEIDNQNKRIPTNV